MAKFLSVTFNFKERNPPDDLSKTFDKALDWVAYAPNCWILWTSSDEKKWYRRLKSVMHEKDNVFIVEINLENRAGWLPRPIWDWINKVR